MSMNFTPFYGLSIKDTAFEVGMEGRLVLQTFTDVLNLFDNEDEELEIFYELFYTEDECDDFTDYVYGLQTYDIENDKIEFNKMNTGDSSFISSVGKFVESIKNSNITIPKDSIILIEGYFNKIQSYKLTPKIYSVYL